MSRYTGYICVLLFALTVSCTVGPEYRRPEKVAESTSAFKEYISHVQDVTEAGGISRWWRRMQDPWMDRHVRLLIEENLQLKEAAARIEQARAQIGIEKGERLPDISLSAATRRRVQSLESLAISSGVPAVGGGMDERIYITQVEAGLSTSWQLDLFGRIKKRISAATGRYQAFRADAVALVHSLIAELARGRVALATLKRRLELTEETVESRKITLNTVERRYRLGARGISAEDVYLARENLSSAASILPDLRRQMAEQAYSLDVLMGRVPGFLNFSDITLSPLPPPQDIDVGLPAHLLDRRPDLQAAELRLIAETEEIGVAIANLYPDLTLNGNIGVQNDDFSDLIRGNGFLASLAGNILVRIFEGGRLRANIDLQEAQARELAASYARQVLSAIAEVEIALSNSRYLSERIAELEIRKTNIRKADEEAWVNYRRGLRPLVEVLELQRRRYNAEQEYLLTAQAAWNNRIALYLALGGDWLDEKPVLRPLPVPTVSDHERR
ncbi:MAG: efflux transporter outer membrane subunit [Syntrophales bacterium]|jgi:NodT family efflux transporter outer membrane factor (OMF) lipoprotein|nr:efflux transporter outer membrane subunit [Syntrophales bacterium]MDY0044245.1 efflux transporter outer membrane subunit [Syntrophales bacterium]